MYRDRAVNHSVPSSANLTFDITALYISIMKVLNRIDERTLPCGNPINVVNVVFSRPNAENCPGFPHH